MKKTEVNTSLSARIKRRNSCGFKGEGTKGKWEKSSPWGKWDEQPTRLADKAREIGKNANCNLHKHQQSMDLRLMLNKYESIK